VSEPLAIITIVVGIALVIGIAARGATASAADALEGWTVGGRQFGTLLVFVLIAGEAYTTFTFLGAAGWAYGKGATAFYIPAYGILAYLLSYFTLPPIWRYAAEHRLVSQGQFFARKYESPLLGTVVSLVGLIALLPYLALQFRGLGLIVTTSSGGALAPVPASIGAAVVMVTYVVVSGMRGSAWVAVLKDAMILVAVIGIGLALPAHYYGSVPGMFHAVHAARPTLLTLPPHGFSPTWFASTVALTALGFYLWPHSFASVYSARSTDALRRSAAVLPLYQLMVVFVFFVGFTAVLQVPGLAGDRVDLSLLRLVRQTYPPAIMGLVGAAGVLTALVPGSVILVGAASTLVRLVPQRTNRLRVDGDNATASRLLVPVIAAAGVVLSATAGTTVVGLLLAGYAIVSQLVPALLAALPARPLATARGALAGLIAGESIVAYFAITGKTLAALVPGWPHALTDCNVGLVALLANAAVMVLVSVGTAPTHRGVVS
jgi:solute:Na+ symporter, SSS family